MFEDSVVSFSGRRRSRLRALADDAAIRRHAVHLELQDAAVLEAQLENLAILRNGW